MIAYLLRHGIAEDHGVRRDEARRLTRQGHDKLAAAATAWRRCAASTLGLRPPAAMGLLLCGSGAIPLKKGMLVGVDLPSATAATGRLVVCLGARQAARVGADRAGRSSRPR